MSDTTNATLSADARQEVQKMIETAFDSRSTVLIDSITAAVVGELKKDGGSLATSGTTTPKDSVEEQINEIRAEYRANKKGLQHMNVTEEVYIRSTCKDLGIDYDEYLADKAA